jgi:hypothetical protein
VKQAAPSPEPTLEELRVWRRLADRAALAAKTPLAAAGELFQAARKAGKAILPLNQRHRDSAFCELVRHAQRFASCAPEVRPAAAPALAALAVRVRDALGVAAPSPDRDPPQAVDSPAPRRRRDIDDMDDA